jgi:hypothetical protein
MKITGLNYELVAVNGIIQSVGAYMVQGDVLIFHQAPQIGDRISITIGKIRTEHEGNGSRTVFEMPNNEGLQFEQFMARVWEHRDNPTVKDQLEKLKIVMELVR